MNLTHIFKYHFTFEYWTAHVNEAGETVYSKEDERKGMYIPGGSDTSQLVCAQPMDYPTIVRNLRDRSGTLLFENPMYVVSAEPQLDPFSNVVAYKHRLRRELPREYSDFITEVLRA